MTSLARKLEHAIKRRSAAELAHLAQVRREHELERNRAIGQAAAAAADSMAASAAAAAAGKGSGQ